MKLLMQKSFGQRKVLLAIAVAALLLLTVPVLISLLKRWQNAGFEHGYPVALMAAALAYMRFKSGEIRTSKPSALQRSSRSAAAWA